MTTIPNKTSKSVIKFLERLNAQHGIPKKLHEDNMPYNSKEMHQFAKNCDFKIITSSPTYAQGNALAEVRLSIVKKWL